MIWVEVLSRHRDVTARFRINARELSIGRSYDNDVILDDPYVAARHLKVFQDEAGQLMAQDLGSANGMYLDRSRSRLARVAVDGNVPIRLGHTLIRIRETSHAVESERLVRSASRVMQIAAAVVLGLALLTLAAINVWFTQTSEPHLSDYLIPLLTLIGVGLIWIGMWSLLSRLFSGQSHFLRHVLIAEAVALTFWTYNEVTQFLAFSLSWSIAYTYAYVASWLALAVMCFLHLREVGRTHLVAKGVVVAVLLVIAVAVQTLQRSEAYANSGRRTVWHGLMPPGLRMAPLQDETTFFAGVGRLRTKLDADRAEVRSDANPR